MSKVHNKMPIYAWNNLIKEIYIWEGMDTYKAMRWPCPEGFHVPTAQERANIMGNNWWVIWNNSSCESMLKMPYAWYISSSWSISTANNMYYWTCTSSGKDYARIFIATNSWYNDPINNNQVRWVWASIRPFKDRPIVPDNTRTQLANRVFWNATLGLISVRVWTSKWMTIADKNLWATNVWNNWDTKSENNCGKRYQRWNNYWFNWWISPSKTSSTPVDTSSNWPWNYYSSDTFITIWTWTDPTNNDLRWWVTGITKEGNVIEVYRWVDLIRTK